jgi:hypothetical protein
MIMASRSIKRVAAAVALAASVTVLGGVVGSASAQDHDLVLPAGVACADFDLGLDFGVDSRKLHEFTDANGDVVRAILAGRANAVTLTNVETDATLTVGARGSMWNIVNHSDGTSTITTHGHLVLILFPTDVPAGPATTLYIGRVVFTFDNVTGFTEVLGATGRTTDLCAALSG